MDIEENNITPPQYTPTLKVYRLNDKAVLPHRKTEAAACYDVSACWVYTDEVKIRLSNASVPLSSEITDTYVNLAPGSTALIPTGLILDIPENHHVKIYLRSSIGYKRDLIQPHSVGVVDEDYIDPLYILVRNVGKDFVRIDNGERLAQIELVPTYEFGGVVETEVKPTQKTNRIGGLGSTGKY